MASSISSPPTAVGRQSSSPRRFSLTGPSIVYDPRTVAARRDLADVDLADRIFAPHYAKALATVAAVDTAILADAGGDAAAAVTLPAGAAFRVLELTDRLAWGQAGTDGAVGYVDRHALVIG